MTGTATARAIDAVWRIESAKIIGGLARMVRDVGLAEELAQEALLAADGLQGEATRVSTKGVVDGPFSEAKELVGGYWIIQAKDRDEALEWAKRVPLSGDSFVELRQIFEESDFSEEIQEAAKLSNE